MRQKLKNVIRVIWRNKVSIGTAVLSILAFIISVLSYCNVDLVQKEIDITSFQHNQDTERLCYSLIERETGKSNNITVDGNEFSLGIPDIEIKLKSGMIHKMRIIKYDDDYINDIKCDFNDISLSDNPYDIRLNGDKNSISLCVGIDEEDNGTSIKQIDKGIFVHYYFMYFEGISGDRYMSLVCEYMDINTGKSRLCFFDESDLFSVSVPSGFEDIFKQYMKLYQVYVERNLV
ncbi:MAG: hypothetical protein ACRDBO_11505 [Lachnospiraceae bacterium]